MLSHSKIKFGCFFLYSVISIGLLIQNSLFMLQSRDVSHNEKLLTELNSNIAQSQEIQTRLVNEIQENVKKHAALEEKISQYRNVAQALEENIESNQRLQRSNLLLKNQISEAQSKKNEAETELVNKLSELKSIAEELRTKDQEFSQLKDLQQAYLDLKKQKIDLDLQYKSLQSNSNQLNERIIQQQKELKDLHEVSLKFESSKKEMNNLEKNKSILQQEISDKQAQLNSIIVQQNSASANLLEIQNTLAAHKIQVIQLNENIMQQQQSAGRLEQLEFTLSTRRLELGKLEEEHRIHVFKNAEEIKQANQKIDDLNTTIHELETKKNKQYLTDSEFELP